MGLTTNLKGSQIKIFRNRRWARRSTLPKSNKTHLLGSRIGVVTSTTPLVGRAKWVDEVRRIVPRISVVTGWKGLPPILYAQMIVRLAWAPVGIEHRFVAGPGVAQLMRAARIHKARHIFELEEVTNRKRHHHWY
jgi:hypothetical protein